MHHSQLSHHNIPARRTRFVSLCFAIAATYLGAYERLETREERNALVSALDVLLRAFARNVEGDIDASAAMAQVRRAVSDYESMEAQYRRSTCTCDHGGEHVRGPHGCEAEDRYGNVCSCIYGEVRIR